jgi:two-component system, cell cycle sensor histidine kinase and response regulator CckA
MMMCDKPNYEELEQKIKDLEAECTRYKNECREIQNKFKIIADDTYSWEYLIGTDGKLHYISPSCRYYTGYTQAEFLEGDNLLQKIIHPDDARIFTEHLTQEQDGHLVESMEFRIRDRNGKIRWLSHSCRPVYDENHTLLGRRASNWEITDRKQAERQRDKITASRKKTSNLLNTILDAIPDVIGVQAPPHRVIRYNRAGYEFFGRKPSEVIGKNCHELIGREMPCHRCATSEVYDTQKNARVEKYVEELGKWLDVRAYPVFGADGNISRVVEHIRDISKEKSAEIKLKQAQETLVTILDSIDAHIYVADIDSFEVLFMNKKMIDDFSADFVGTRCYESFRNESKPCGHCTNKLLLDKNQNPKGAHTWQGINPLTNRWYINYDRAIKWNDGRMVRIQIATDITEAKQNENERLKMEQQLLQAQKYEAIGTLAGGIAHDFNNLLMGIQGYASLIAADLEVSHPHAKKVKSIEKYIHNATDLTKQLLGFARKGKYEVRPIDINELLLKSATMFGRTKKEIRIHTKFQDPPPVVEADSSQIEQVLLNLYVNAWQAMPGSGEIYLETSVVDLDEAFCLPHAAKPGRYTKISITDTGVGMDKATLQRIFDPFFTTKAKSRGTGLGLASVYGIVRNHSGIVTVYSQVGHGTTFDLYLPVASQDIQPELPLKTGFIKGSETVLLVDDEEMIIEVGQAMLEKLGYRVVVARRGEAAVDTVSTRSEGIDLIILDLVMPGMDGGTAFDLIRANQPNIPVILSSGYSMTGKVTDIMQKGCNGFIQKPFNISELSKMIRKVLDKV